MKEQKPNNRIFKNNFVEWLSKTNAYVVSATYILMALIILIYQFYERDLQIFLGIAIFLSGLIFFSFMEYIVHRYSFHARPKNDKPNLSFRLHHVHHEHPRDKKRLALPLPVGLLIASIVYGVFRLILGVYAPYFFPGFIIGYALYILIHYRIHTCRPPRNAFRVLWTNHYIHHYKDDTKAFGVTSPLWDLLFNTTYESRK
ncbi:sterol desaturase family protein [Robertkochia solimangrovi]|uniref:sterol desaturase family protein n=1 Tax=Robertkochia solimangrovi TaxID=2213046 RepID=UPI0013A56185|nr:sterol desaturase family protein [Robertkochia solimangrovi]